VPAAAERAGKTVFDGMTEAVIYPGDLPEDPGALFKDESAFKGLASGKLEDSDYRFLRFRPPVLGADGDGALPHIRLDRTLQFLLGDRLR
jgi:predicted YcjX-like family ATPase